MNNFFFDNLLLKPFDRETEITENNLSEFLKYLLNRFSLYFYKENSWNWEVIDGREGLNLDVAEKLNLIVHTYHFNDLMDERHLELEEQYK